MKKILFPILILVFFAVGCGREKSEDPSPKAPPPAVENTENLIPFQKSTSGDKSFAFIFTRENMIGILGAYKPNTPITLLQKIPCRAKTGQTTNLIENGYKIEYTPIQVPDSCKLIETATIAVIKKEVKEFVIVPTKKVDDKQLIQTWDKKIKKSDALKTLINRIKEDGKPQSLELIPMKPFEMFSFTDKNIDGLIAVYGTSGPRVLILKNVIYGLTGPCSYENFKLFRLNGVLYFESGSGLCATGFTGQELYKITPKGAEIVYNDYSWTD